MKRDIIQWLLFFLFAGLALLLGMGDVKHQAIAGIFLGCVCMLAAAKLADIIVD